MKKIGYIDITFKSEEKEQIMRWTSLLGKENLFTTLIDGKVEGGDLSHKLHLTLFYGFDHDNLDQEEISRSIHAIKVEKIGVAGLGAFPVPGYDCKVLFLRVRDVDNCLNEIHEGFKRFPYFQEYQQEQYIPHITLGYVHKDFDYTKVSLPSSLDHLSVDKIEYHLKS